MTHLPVLVDPSHGAGRAALVPPLALAAAAVGADGLLIEIHPRPETARSDGSQALRPAELPGLLARCRAVAEIAREE
jgi:3-deoxy-7-phosphoheptulonate synthase